MIPYLGERSEVGLDGLLIGKRLEGHAEEPDLSVAVCLRRRRRGCLLRRRGILIGGFRRLALHKLLHAAAVAREGLASERGSANKRTLAACGDSRKVHSSKCGNMQNSDDGSARSRVSVGSGDAGAGDTGA